MHISRSKNAETGKIPLLCRDLLYLEEYLMQPYEFLRYDNNRWDSKFVLKHLGEYKFFY